MVTDVSLDRTLAQEAVATASLAPSIHNTQPWRWRLTGGTLALYADPDRRLGAIDPDGRQLLVSCGAALFHAWLALRSHGIAVDVTLLPEGLGYADLDLDLAGGQPLATLTAAGTRAPDDDELAMLAAAQARHTDRRPFDPRALPAGILTELRRAAEAEGGWLMSLDKIDHRIDAVVLTARADWMEHLDPAYQVELESWSRTDAAAVDGIPRGAVVGADPRRASEFPLRDFDVVGEPGLHAAAGEVERPAIVVIGTDADRPVDRLVAGRALARVLLMVTARGAAASPLGQAVDIDATRVLIRQMLGVIGDVQMILRVGYPRADDAPLEPTPRRPVADILEITD